MKTKYLATIIGLSIAVICLLGSIREIYLLRIFISIGFSLPGILIFENIFQSVFGMDNYWMVCFAIVILELLLFLLLSYWYFRKLIRDKKENKPLNIRRLSMYFLLLQFIVHPTELYIWSLNHLNAKDGQSILGILETFPYSSLVFLIIGAAIDLT